MIRYPRWTHLLFGGRAKVRLYMKKQLVLILVSVLLGATAATAANLSNNFEISSNWHCKNGDVKTLFTRTGKFIKWTDPDKPDWGTLWIANGTIPGTDRLDSSATSVVTDNSATLRVDPPAGKIGEGRLKSAIQITVTSDSTCEMTQEESSKYGNDSCRSTSCTIK